MLPPSLSILLLRPFLVLTLLQIPAHAGFLSSVCSPNDTYTSGSTFEYNLHSLLESLYTNATFHGSFYAQSLGNGTDMVYGLIMCYADASVDGCWGCLKDATSEAPQRCPGNATATIYHDECLLRYSRQDFRSQLVADFSDQYCLANSNATLDDASKNLVTNLIPNISMGAEQDPQLTAYRETKTNTRNISALVQCTRDLSQDGCRQCLEGATVNKSRFPACSHNLTRTGMRLMLPSCYIRFESYYLNNITFPKAAGLTPSPVAGPAGGSKSNSTVVIVVSAVVASFGLVAVGFYAWLMCGASKNNEDYLQETVETELRYILNPNAEYQVFNFAILKTATNNFSDVNKLGRGGFGPVYKGILPDGQEIAVKRLLRCSGQGITEFKNEVDSLAKLEHKNLVQLLGCCITNQEKLLCYEYLPNGSLDKILFEKDTSRGAELSWKLRYKIIEGICNGLHYLHEESRLKIIHRDLKVGNILLDKDMNPKISDFGLARFFEEQVTHKDTNVIVGTFGYIAPEYVNCGSYSAKSDVYSFGILLLEIPTGQKCSSVVGSNRISTLRDNALVHWINGTISQLKDPTLEENCLEEIKRCFHIALLCVQEDPINRPNMVAVRTMLGGSSLTIPDLPSAWSPSEQLNFAILEETSTTRFHSVNSQAERSQGMTHESNN